MADQNKVLIRLVYGADHSLSKDSQEYELAEEIRRDEREAIAQMFEGAPALVQFAQNDQGGCLVCGFTPKLVIKAIRARGTT